MARLRANLAYGTVTDNPLLVGATTLNSAELPRLAAASSPDIYAVTLDPHREHGEPEIVHVTSYDGSATSATILRGQEGTTAREHPSGTRWEHSPTADDLLTIKTGVYTGDGTTDRLIDIGFTPNFVILIAGSGNVHFSDMRGQTATHTGFGARIMPTPSVSNANGPRPVCATDGFIVSGTDTSHTNVSTRTYSYIAFRQTE